MTVKKHYKEGIIEERTRELRELALFYKTDKKKKREKDKKQNFKEEICNMMSMQGELTAYCLVPARI